MARTFTSIVELQGAMQQCIDIALQNVALRVKEQLKQYIQDDFYSTYEPHILHSFIKLKSFEKENNL